MLKATLVVLLGLTLAAVSPLSASRENLRLLTGAARQASRGDTATALQVVDRILGQPGRDESKAYALYLKGLLEGGRGYSDSARNAWGKLIIEYPSSGYMGMTLAQLGVLLHNQGDDSAAVRVLEPVAASFRDSSFTPSALMALVRAADRSGLDRKAIRAGLDFLSLEGVAGRDRVPVLQRTAALLYRAGRSEEAWSLVRRIEEATGRGLGELDLGTQMLAIGCLTGIGRPDSALRLTEELRRSSGDQVLNTPGMQYLIGQARLSLGDMVGADSIFSALLSLGAHSGESFSRDTLLALLMNIERAQGRADRYFEHSRARVEGLRDADKALEVLLSAASVARLSGRYAPLTPTLEAFESRFQANPHRREARLLNARILAARDGRNQALAALAELRQSETDSVFLARVSLATAELYIDAGDTLRAEAELRDYLSTGSDPLGNRDSVLWALSRIERQRGRYPSEQVLLSNLAESHPASRFWESAEARLEQLRRFELTRPEAAATELLDLYSGGVQQITPQRLAQIAAEYLSDYDRAAALLRGAGVVSPADRSRLAEYLYLAGLREQDRGTGRGAEKITQAWGELTRALEESVEFPARDRAIRLYLEIYRSRHGVLSPSQLAGAEELLRAELPRLPAGAARTAVLLWLAERHQSAASGVAGLAAMAQGDSARAMLTGAIRSGGEANQVGRAFLDLARSVENAGFAGAMDSAAYLYGVLRNRYPQSRWSALAGLRLAAIHLEQERFSVAYEAVRAWIERNPTAAHNPETREVLAAASFHTGRFGRAADLFGKMAADSLPPEKRIRFQCYRIRSLAEMGDYAGASALLRDYLNTYTDQASLQAGYTVAVQIYLAAGNQPQAMQYLAQVPENSEFHPLARVWWLNALLDQGGNSDRIRRELERFRKAPWNSFYEADPAHLAYRGIMAAYMAEGRADKVEEARNEFRRNYPERRAGLSVLMLDEIEYLLRSSQTDKAGALYNDLRLLFGDVYPEDRVLWVGLLLAQARGDMAAYSSGLEQLAGRYEWSHWGVEAKKRLVKLYIGANRVEPAQDLVEKLRPEAVSEAEMIWMRAMLFGARGDWVSAQELYSRSWAALGDSRIAAATVLDWAEASLRADRTDRARELLSRLWSADPQTVIEARFLLASVLRSTRQHGDAIEVLDGLQTSYAGQRETVLRALYQKGLTQESMGDRDAAVETYRSIESTGGERSDWTRSARDRLRAIESGRPANVP